MTEELVYDGFLKIALVETEIKGNKVMREKLIFKDVVSALVVDAKDRMGLVLQFRPTAGEHLWEIPAGLMDKPHLTQKETLLEELEEECEIAKGDIIIVNPKPIYSYFIMPGSSDAKNYIYFVSVTEQTDKKVADVDVEEVRWFTKGEILSMLLNGDIQDSKTTLMANYFVHNY